MIACSRTRLSYTQAMTLIMPIKLIECKFHWNHCVRKFNSIWIPNNVLATLDYKIVPFASRKWFQLYSLDSITHTSTPSSNDPTKKTREKEINKCDSVKKSRLLCIKFTISWILLNPAFYIKYEIIIIFF